MIWSVYSGRVARSPVTSVESPLAKAYGCEALRQSGRIADSFGSIVAISTYNPGSANPCPTWSGSVVVFGRAASSSGWEIRTELVHPNSTQSAKGAQFGVQVRFLTQNHLLVTSAGDSNGAGQSTGAMHLCMSYDDYSRVWTCNTTIAPPPLGTVSSSVQEGFEFGSSVEVAKYSDGQSYFIAVGSKHSTFDAPVTLFTWNGYEIAFHSSVVPLLPRAEANIAYNVPEGFGTAIADVSASTICISSPQMYDTEFKSKNVVDCFEWNPTDCVWRLSQTLAAFEAEDFSFGQTLLSFDNTLVTSSRIGEAGSEQQTVKLFQRIQQGEQWQLSSSVQIGKSGNVKGLAFIDSSTLLVGQERGARA